MEIIKHIEKGNNCEESKQLQFLKEITIKGL